MCINHARGVACVTTTRFGLSGATGRITLPKSLNARLDVGRAVGMGHLLQRKISELGINIVITPLAGCRGVTTSCLMNTPASEHLLGNPLIVNTC